eukprot:Clim_evm20s205 gene=Clim_evmTU20s205
MTTMENRFNEVQGLLIRTQHNLSQLENGIHATVEMKGNVSNSLQTLQVKVDELLDKANREHPSQRHVAQTRAQAIANEFRMLQYAFNNYIEREREKEREAKEREELLNRRFTPLSTNDTILNMEAQDYYANENQRLKGVGRDIDGFLNYGGAILENLTNQRDVLKGVRTRVLNIGNQLGLSQSLMGMIEGRQKGDTYILYGGMLITLILMFLIWYYLG